MPRQRVRMWNAVVWAFAMLADAVVLTGVDGSVFVAALMVLVAGAVESRSVSGQSRSVD